MVALMVDSRVDWKVGVTAWMDALMVDWRAALMVGLLETLQG